MPHVLKHLRDPTCIQKLSITRYAYLIIIYDNACGCNSTRVPDVDIVYRQIMTDLWYLIIFVHFLGVLLNSCPSSQTGEHLGTSCLSSKPFFGN